MAATSEATIEEPARTSDHSGWMFLFAAILIATSTTLMLQATRVFVSYLVFVIDQSERLMLGLTAVGVFGAIAIGGVLLRVSGWRMSLLVGVIGLGLSRLVLQLWQDPEPRLILAAIAIVSWGWLIIPMLNAARDAAALGLVLGLALDVAIRTAFLTVDLPWMPDLPAHVTTFALISVFAIAAVATLRWSAPITPGGVPVVSLVAIGPALAIFHLMTGNLGLAQVLLDADFPVAATIVALGTILGLAIVAVELLARSIPGGSNWLLSARFEGPVAVLILVIVALAGAALFWWGSLLAGVGLVAAIAAAIVLLAMAVLNSQPGRWRGGGVTLWLTIGMLLQVALLFAYYTFTGAPVVIVIAWALLLVGSLAAGSPPALEVSSRAPSIAVPIVSLVALLALAAGWRTLTWSEPAAGSPLDSQFTVMTYNLQNGFDINEAFSLDEQAETIASADPDIVILQEVSRGWLVSSNVDEALWLSQELDMPIVFGASSGDGLWGNAILSRAPISESDVHHFETTQNLRRGVIEARVTSTGEPLWVFATHLDNPSGAGEVRSEQVEELLDIWDGRTPAVIGGDLNMDPDDDVLGALLEEGFLDTGENLGEDAFTSEDRRRIDYILATPELELQDIEILPRRTSDHLPVVARLEAE